MATEDELHGITVVEVQPNDGYTYIEVKPTDQQFVIEVQSVKDSTGQKAGINLVGDELHEVTIVEVQPNDGYTAVEVKPTDHQSVVEILSVRGPTGPAGPTGPTGPTGPAIPVGPDGPVLTAEGALVTYTGPTQSIPDSIETAVIFDTEIQDSRDYFWSPQVPTRLLVPTAGWYTLYGQLQYAKTGPHPSTEFTGLTQRALWFRVNSSVERLGYVRDVPLEDGSGFCLTTSASLYFDADTIIELVTLHDSGMAVALMGPIAFSIGRQGGPAGPAGPTGPAGTYGSLDNLSDVTITSAKANDLLAFNGSQWINRPQTYVTDGGNF